MLLSTRLQCGIGVPEVQQIVAEKAVQEFVTTKVFFAFLNSVCAYAELFLTISSFLHATRFSHEKAVCLSVRLSNA